MNLLRQIKKQWIAVSLCSIAAGIVLLSIATVISLHRAPPSFDFIHKNIKKPQVLDRHDNPLTITYQNHWNVHNQVDLHNIPTFLQQIIILAEDKRFYQHQGLDWWARLHALWQNIKALRAVRGASTISEQVVRMLHPRPRTFWSRWLEGFEAQILEQRFSKADILEFYLNQVPYASQRRGVAQAAHFYFNRDLDTLSHKEMLTLAVLIRAPGRMDLYGPRKGAIEAPLLRLANAAMEHHVLDKPTLEQIRQENLHLATPTLPVKAEHFVHYIYQSHSHQAGKNIESTLDGELQGFVQQIINKQVSNLHKQNVNNGAVLVVDHIHNEVLAWVVSNYRRSSDQGSEIGLSIDAVRTPRQAGSTLKPFAYAAALEKGWTVSTMIKDDPLSQAVGVGLHDYHNYSRSHYGAVSVRNALGNSLNIPAVKAVQYVGVSHFLKTLRLLGIHSLEQHPDHYGDGLALGNGELSLLELVSAYAVLARGGYYEAFHTKINNHSSPYPYPYRVFSPETSSLIGHILSDPNARQLEFGESSILNLPVQTAVKSGTSNDYRDAWVVGYNHQYTVGVWMGNMDNTAMDKVTGSKGPALVLRTVFSRLNKNKETKPLYFSPNLVKHDVCIESGLRANHSCATRSEWFIPGNIPEQQPTDRSPSKPKRQKPVKIQQPSNNLMLAMDPRIPDDKEAFQLVLSSEDKVEKVHWYLNDKLLASTTTADYVWNLQRGQHTLYAEVWGKNEKYRRTGKVTFLVK